MRWMLPLLLVCVGPSMTGGAEPSGWTPESGDLLFASGRDGNTEIYVLRAGETEWANLTRHLSGDNWPVWSPDGTRIAFQSNRTGNLDVWTMKTDGSELLQLTHDPEPDYLPAWSPDGKSILFSSWRRTKGEAKRAPHFYVMSADGSGQRRLVKESPETSVGATWSPDGKHVVFSRKVGELGADIFIADGDGRRERRLTNDKGRHKDREVYNGAPVFSPDGNSIAFYSDDGTHSALEVIRTDGSDRRMVLAEGKNWYPRWSPDGRWLVYTAEVSGAKGNIDVLAIPVAAGGKPVLLAGGDKREQEGSWRPK